MGTGVPWKFLKIYNKFDFEPPGYPLSKWDVLVVTFSLLVFSSSLISKAPLCFDSSFLLRPSDSSNVSCYIFIRYFWCPLNPQTPLVLFCIILVTIKLFYLLLYSYCSEGSVKLSSQKNIYLCTEFEEYVPQSQDYGPRSEGPLRLECFAYWF